MQGPKDSLPSLIVQTLQPCVKKPPNFAQGLKFLISIRNVLGAQGLLGFLKALGGCTGVAQHIHAFVIVQHTHIIGTVYYVFGQASLRFLILRVLSSADSCKSSLESLFMSRFAKLLFAI